MRSKCIVPLIPDIPENRLPTELQVLGHYLWQVKQSTAIRSKRNLAVNTARAVKNIWDRAYISCGEERSIIRQLFGNKDSVIQRLYDISISFYVIYLSYNV